MDGDSFAHRAYHGLPKTIERVGGKPAGAIVGFANFLLRIVENERPPAPTPPSPPAPAPREVAPRIGDDPFRNPPAAPPIVVERPQAAPAAVPRAETADPDDKPRFLR